MKKVLIFLLLLASYHVDAQLLGGGGRRGMIIYMGGDSTSAPLTADRIFDALNYVPLNPNIPTNDPAYISSLAKTKVDLGNVENLSPLDMPVSTAVANALLAKANATDVATALLAKADKATIEAAVALKANITDLNNGLALKLNITTFNSAIALKADQTSVTSSLALKANTSDVTASLLLKSDKTTTDAAIALKANTTDVNSALELKANITDVNTSLAGKANTADLAAKANTADVTTLLAGKEPTIAAGTSGQFLSWDKTWRTPAGGTTDAGLLTGTAPESIIPTAIARVSTVNSSLALKADESSVVTRLAAKAGTASPAFTGTPSVPTATAGTNTTQIASTAFVTTAVSGKADVSAVNNKITTGTLSTVNGLNLESGSPINITTATSYQFVTPEMFVPVGVTPTESYDWTDVFVDMVNALADGGEINLQPGKKYRVLRLLINGKSATIRGNGATLIQIANQGVLSLTGGWEWLNRSITAIDTVNKTITLSTGDPTLKLGDVIKVYSNDTIPGSPPSGGAWARIGEYATVKSINGDGTLVTLTGYFKEKFRVNAGPGNTVSTGLRAAKSNGVGFKVYNLKFETEGLYEGNTVGETTTFWNSHYFGLVNTINSVVDDISCNKGYGALLSASSNYNYKFNKVNATNMVNQQSTARFGYGINDRSGQNGTITNCTFINCRHGYTTNTDQLSSSSTQVEKYGRTRDVVVSNSFAAGSSNSGFDTHEEAYNIVFDNCITYGSFEGDGAIGAGVTTRGELVTIRNFKDYGSKVGVRVEGEFQVPGNTIIENSRFENNQVQSLLISSGVKVRNSYFSTKTASSACLIYGHTPVYLEDVYLVGRTSASASANMALQIYDDGQVTFKNLTLDVSEMPKRYSDPEETILRNAYGAHFRTAGYSFVGDGLFIKGSKATNNLVYVMRDEGSPGGSVSVSGMGPIPTGVSRSQGLTFNPNTRLITSAADITTLVPRSQDEKVFDTVNKVWYQAKGLVAGDFVAIGGSGAGSGDVTQAGANDFTGVNTFAANTSLATVTANGHITPGAGSAYNIGNSSTRFAGMYANGFWAGAAVSYGTTVASSGISFRQGTTLQIPFGLKATTGNAYFQTASTEPADIPSARVFINSTTQGFLTPRMTTTERNAIASPAEGLEVYNTTTKNKEFFDGTIWKSGSSGGSGDVTLAGNNAMTGRNTFSDLVTVSDSITVSGSLHVPGNTTMLGAITAANILPISSGVYTLGSGSNRWNQINVNNVLGGGGFAFGTSTTSAGISMRHGSNTPLYFHPTTSEMTLQDPSVVGNPTAVPSSRFTINSTTRGFLMPRMTTTERDAIASPVEGLQIYNLTTHAKEFYNGTAWTTGISGGGSGDAVLAANNAFTGRNTFSDLATFSDSATVSGALTVTGNTNLGTLTLGGTITPAVGSAYNIGTSSLRLATVYSNAFLAGGSVGYGTTVGSTGITFRQGTSAQISLGIEGTTGNAYLQTPGAAPSPSGYKWDVYGTTRATQYFVSALNTAPASATDTGVTGEIRVTSGAIYVCIANNVWVRTALSTF